MNQTENHTETSVRETFFKRTKAWVLRDFWRKVVALSLALLLYSTLSQKNEVAEMHCNEAVTLELPAGLICRNSPDSLQVSLTIAGDKRRLDAFDPAKLRIRGKVDAQNFVPGRAYKLRLRSDDVSGLDRRLRVQTITPNDIKLDLEKVVAKRVPVKAKFESERNLAQDYRIAGTHFVPAEVTISGPESLLKSISEISTQSIPIDGKITESFDYRTGLYVPEGVHVDHPQVDAQVEIKKAFIERTFTSVPLLTVQSAEHTRKFKVRKINPESVTVTLRGPKEIMVKLPSEEITAFLNINAVKKAGVFEMTVNPMLETQYAEVSVRSIQPAVAEVTIDSE